MALMGVKPDDSVDKWPPIANARLARRMTRQQLDDAHDVICFKPEKNGLGKGDTNIFGLALIEVFNEAKFNGKIVSALDINQKAVAEFVSGG